MYRCSILMEKTLPSPFLLLFFLIGRVCRKFMTYVGQGNLHVFLEIFLALDFTAVLALWADGWISHHSPSHKTQRHAQEFETLSCFSVPSSSVPFFLSKLSGSYVGQWWPQGCFLHSVWPQGQRSQWKFCTCRQHRERRQVGAEGGEQACQQWTCVSSSPLPIMTASPCSLSCPTYVKNRSPVTYSLAFPFVCYPCVVMIC